eukprot:6427471-Prymnesium_polylepis.1
MAERVVDGKIDVRRALPRARGALAATSSVDNVAGRLQVDDCLAIELSAIGDPEQVEQIDVRPGG